VFSLFCFSVKQSLWSASLTSCAVVRMTCRVLSYVQWTSMSLARPLRPRLISSCNPLNTTVERRNRHCFSSTKISSLCFFVHAHRDCVLLAADSSLRLQTNNRRLHRYANAKEYRAMYVPSKLSGMGMLYDRSRN
jgi:hypothetical protein